MVSCTSHYHGNNTTNTVPQNCHCLMYLHFHFQSLESDPTVEYVEKPVTATKRKRSGGEEQGINHYVV